MWILGLLGVAVVMGMAVLLQRHSVKRGIRKKLRSRPQLSVHEFARQHFGPSPVSAAARVMEVLQRHVDIRLQGALPDDKLVEDLMMDELDSLAVLEFVLDLEREFGTEIPNEDAQALRRIGEVIEYVKTGKSQGCPGAPN